MNIRTRLIVLATLVVASVLALMYSDWTSFRESKLFSRRYDDFIEQKDLLADVLPPPAFALEIFSAAHRYRQLDPPRRRILRDEIGMLRTGFAERWEHWIGIARQERHKQLEIRARDSGNELIAGVMACIERMDADADPATIARSLAEIDDRFTRHLAAIRLMVDAVNEEIAAQERDARVVERAAERRLVLGGSLSIVLVVIGSWLIGRSIIRQVARAVSQLGVSSQHVSTAASELSAGAQRIAQGASDQAASLEQTTASLEELASTCRQNAESARQADTLAHEAVQTSEEGESNARRSAGDAASQLRELMVAIDAIRQSTDKTTAVVASIDDIAIQINLLALNAAVEAARAGEAGRGFAVVADEVRTLATRSTEEARNTSELIKESRTNAERVQTMARAVQDHLARSLDRDVVANFQQLVGKMRGMSKLIAEVAAASGEQAKGVGQINAAIAQMDKVTQENAAGAEQTAAASEEMRSQATELRGTILDLNQLVDGRAARTAAGVTVGAVPAAPLASGATPRIRASLGATPSTTAKAASAPRGSSP